MKWYFVLFLPLLIAGCKREERPLSIPFVQPTPPRITAIEVRENKCDMPFLATITPIVSNAIGGERFYWVIGGTPYNGAQITLNIVQPELIQGLCIVENQVGSDSFRFTITYASTSLPVIPEFGFGAFNDNFRAPASISFEDLSLRATSVRWEFGDGFSSTLRNPAYVYRNPGNYTVTLYAYCESDTQSISKTIQIQNAPNRLNFRRFVLEQIPRNYIPENQFDDTYGGDFYFSLFSGGFNIGNSHIYRNRSRAPLIWQVPENWNGDSRTFFNRAQQYQVLLEDFNEGHVSNTLLLNATFSGLELETLYYPRQLKFGSQGFEIYFDIDYED